MEITDNTLVQIGSLSGTGIRGLVDVFFKSYVVKLKSSEEQFYQTLAFCLHLGQHENTFEHYAGALYTGLKLDAHGIKWNDDTTIVYYASSTDVDDAIIIKGQVNCLVRYDVLSVISSHWRNGEFFIDNEENPVYRSEKLQYEIQNEQNNINPKVVVFIAQDRRAISIILTHGHNMNGHFRLQCRAGRQTLEISKEFAKLLRGAFHDPVNLVHMYWDELQKH